MWIRTIEDVAELVRTRRKELGLSQVELARKVGVSRKWIVDLERGKPTAEVSLVLKTLAATGLFLDAHHSHRPDASTGINESLFDAAREVLERHAPAGMRPRTLRTRKREP